MLDRSKSCNEAVAKGGEDVVRESKEGKTILLVGKVGHGKTFILNKICGAMFKSEMCTMSCTRVLQRGRTIRHGVFVVDTPGFYSAEEIESHTAYQREAIEQNVLSGIYVVIKFGRADDMAETMNKILNFVGDEGIRIIITHVDSGNEIGNVTESIDRLAHLMDVEVKNIIAVGKDTESRVIESFIMATLHGPQRLEVTDVQLASVADLSVGARKFKRDISDVKAKVEAAERACKILLKASAIPERTHAIAITRLATVNMEHQSKEIVTKKAKGLTLEQQNALEREWLFSVSRPLSSFMQATASHRRAQWQRESPLKISFVKDGESHNLKFTLDGIEIHDVEEVPEKLLQMTAKIPKQPTSVQPKKRRRKNKTAFTRNKTGRRSKTLQPSLSPDGDCELTGHVEAITDQPSTSQKKSLGVHNPSETPSNHTETAECREDSLEDFFPLLHEGESRSWRDTLFWVASIACCCLPILIARRADDDKA